MNFSLVVCTYKRVQSLQNLLDSVKTQTLYPTEILIIDGSPDSETELMLHERNYKQLTYIKVENDQIGLTKQRNVGISNVSSSSKVICFLDDDIILENGYFEELLNTYQLYPDALAVSGYITNEVQWENSDRFPNSKEYKYDGFIRIEGSRFRLRRFLGLIDDTPPGFMPTFSNGRPVSFLPPTGKVYHVEQIMGGVSSYKTEVFSELSFSTYFEGYGLYEDADFSLRLAKKGKLYVNTLARLAHYHDTSGRPNKFQYGKMVVRNGWYVWRVKYPSPKLVARLKWNLIVWLQILLRIVNIFNTSKKREAFTEALGRIYGWFSIIFNKPKVSR